MGVIGKVKSIGKKSILWNHRFPRLLIKIFKNSPVFPKNVINVSNVVIGIAVKPIVIGISALV
jgi:hypothetical protein